MRSECRCQCHERTIECTPCFQLHKLVAWVRQYVPDEAGFRDRQAIQYPEIGAEIKARADELRRFGKHLDERLVMIGIESWGHEELDALGAPRVVAP